MSPRTLRLWLKQAKDSPDSCQEITALSEALEHSRGVFEATMIGNIHELGNKKEDWKASAWMLEKTLKHYAKLSQGEIDRRVDEQARELLEKAKAVLPQEYLSLLIDEITAEEEYDAIH